MSLGSVTGQVQNTICSLKNGATFSTSEIRRKFFPGMKSQRLSNSLNYLKEKGIIARTDGTDDYGNLLYRVVNDQPQSIRRIDKAFVKKSTGLYNGTKTLLAYKEALKTRPIIDVLVSIEQGMKMMNNRLADALSQATTTSTPDLKTFTIAELLGEVNQRTAQ